MPVRVHVRKSATRTQSEQVALQALSAAVYPAEEAASWPGRNLDWSPPEWDVAIVDEHGNVISYTGVVTRKGTLDGHPVLIGGIGGVKTHPHSRGLGYATRGLEEALRVLAESTAAFALLVCEPGLVPYYSDLGWLEFSGTLLTLQGGRKVPFEFNRVMVHPVASPAPEAGMIDLEGPPW